MLCPQAKLEGLRLDIVGERLLRELPELEVGVVPELVPIGVHHLLVVVPATGEELRLQHRNAPEVDATKDAVQI